MKAGTRVVIESGPKAGQTAVVVKERGLMIDCITKSGEKVSIVKLFVRLDAYQVRVARRVRV